VRRGIVDDVVHMALSANARGPVRFVAISTDQVFDGKAGIKYSESFERSPTNPYASYKCEMEDKLLALNLPDLLICRTSLILTLDPPGKAVQFCKDALMGTKEVTLFTDELRNMSWVEDLASALIELALNPTGKKSNRDYKFGFR